MDLMRFMGFMGMKTSQILEFDLFVFGVVLLILMCFFVMLFLFMALFIQGDEEEYHDEFELGLSERQTMHEPMRTEGKEFLS